MGNKRERIYGWDFIRVVSAFMVIAAHLTAKITEVWGVTGWFGDNANGGYGALAVSAFFILSGASLFLTAPELENVEMIRSFYCKRIKSIFPMFLFLWTVFFVLRAVMSRNLLWGGSPWKILLSLMGMDGYLKYLIPNYYSIGEWFLGALIILYLLYPVLLRLFLRYRRASTALITVLYILLLCFNPFDMYPARNPITCVLLFWTGMLMCAYREKIYPWISRPAVLCVLAALLLVLLIVPLHLGEIFPMNLAGLLLVLVLWRAGDLLCRNEKVRTTVLSLSRSSFAVFLLQMVLIANIFYRVFGPWINQHTVIFNGLILVVSAVIYLCGHVFSLCWEKAWRTFRAGKA